MVTGIETAGLVLAVLPLVISALESYQNGLRTIKRLYYWEIQIRKLVNTLKIQRSKYKTNLQKLVEAAAPNLGIQDIPEDFSDPVWRGELNALAQAYLGDRYESFQIVVKDYQACVQEIARKLRYINKPRKAGKDDLQALLSGNTKIDGDFVWIKKVDFTMKDKDLHRLTDELDNSNLTLSSFINDSDMLERLRSQPNDSLRAQLLSETMRKIRLQTDYLYEAICNARLPECYASHRVMLHLEDRLPPGASSTRLRQSYPIDQAVTFRLSIAWQSQDPSCSACWHQTAVIVSQTPSVYHLDVDDICRVIDQAQQLDHSVKFHLLDNILLRFHNPQEKLHPAVREVETVTLHDLLQAQTKLQPKEITTIALKLASSLLQLNFTSWLGRHWMKSNISFFRLRSPSSPSVVYTEQPLLEQIFQKQSAPIPSITHTLTPKVTLFEFGILLMEIYNHISFEAWMNANGESCQDDSYYSRLRPAMMWYDQEEHYFPLEYRKVVSRCLRSNFEGYNMSWDDQKFREAVCLNIIEPLQQTCAIW